MFYSGDNTIAVEGQSVIRMWAHCWRKSTRCFLTQAGAAHHHTMAATIKLKELQIQPFISLKLTFLSSKRFLLLFLVLLFEFAAKHQSLGYLAHDQSVVLSVADYQVAQ